VTAVSPSSGPTAGGTSVTITGTGLTAASSVKFGTTNASSFTVNSPTSITATSPAEPAGTVDVTVNTPNGTSASSQADRFTFEAAPTVTAVSPNVGPLAGGTRVTITGTGFLGASAVKFGSANATSVKVNSAASITATSPAGAAGTTDVTVAAAGGTSAASPSDQFLYQDAATVTGVSPNAGPTGGGTSVTITGTNLINVSAVKFGTTTVTSFTVNSATSITAISPARLLGLAGTVDVTVTTARGTSATSLADRFTFQ
jgi:hypothetical protein